jgi:hypothetical protein
MKKILTILMTLTLMSVFSQVTKEIKYPRFEVDSLGKKVVIMTIPQAMKLNNNSNLLEKFEKLSGEMKDYETICVKVINDKDIVISKLDITINKLENQVLIKEDKINSLQNEVSNWMQKNRVLETQIKNRQDIIHEKNKQISNMKVKMYVGGIGGSLVIVGLVLVVLGIF